jgi:hypothetical protein
MPEERDAAAQSSRVSALPVHADNEM